MLLLEKVATPPFLILHKGCEAEFRFILSADETRQAHAVLMETRMWANAQPDGRPAEHRWRPLFNAAKSG